MLTQVVPPQPAAPAGNVPGPRVEPTRGSDTSGFGVTKVPGADTVNPARDRTGWITPPKWLRRTPPAALRS